MICVLTGGTGGAKFVRGLAKLVPGLDLTVIVNTGDDLTCWGLRISPDLDSITYALAGILSRARGWGIDGDTFHCLENMRRMGAPAWFQLGDHDLATHLRRTELLSQNKTLTQATADIARALGIETRLLPMSDDRLETRVLTADGELSFQEYFVRRRYQVAVRSVRFDGAERARPAPGVLEAIAQADAVIIAPSNPVTSIGPILAVPGVCQALQQTGAPVAAISPIIGGAAVSGPAGELMKAQGLPVSIAGVVRCYADFLDLLIADERDSSLGATISQIPVRYTRTLMQTDTEESALARSVLASLGERQIETAAS
jgi:LPPG:FO 2-phospho-L-lactate transferase